MSQPMPIEEIVRQFKSCHTTSHLFKIENFSLLKKYQIKEVESSVFDLGGHKWKLIVCPNGSKGEVSIWLENQASINVDLMYEVFAINQLKEPLETSMLSFPFDISSTSKREGWPNWILLVDLERKGYVIGDCCVFGVKLSRVKPANSGTAECLRLIEKPLNHKTTWVISKFSSLDPEKAHHSKTFVVGNRKWSIEVHPRGHMSEKDKSFSVFLSGVGFINNAPKAKTLATFKLRVLDQVNRNHVEKTVSGWFGANHGCGQFMPLQKLEQPYLVKDKLYVGVEFQLISMTSYC